VPTDSPDGNEKPPLWLLGRIGCTESTAKFEARSSVCPLMTAQSSGMIWYSSGQTGRVRGGGGPTLVCCTLREGLPCRWVQPRSWRV